MKVVTASKQGKFQKEFDAQLEKFREDESYFDDYSKFDITSEEYLLVRVFEFETRTNKKASSVLFLPDAEGNWGQGEGVIASKVTNIVKVIDPGKTGYTKGGVYIVPAHDVMGYVQNPDYLMLLQFSQAKGAEPIGAEDIPRQVPAIRENWSRYWFIRPDRHKLQKGDLLTYLIPKGKLMCSYA